MDAAPSERFLQERFKVNRKAGDLGGGVVTIERSKSKITVPFEVSFSKRSPHQAPLLGACFFLSHSPCLCSLSRWLSLSVK
uniref:Large ribosomal subunit protein eL22 n=1 Tax=Ursus maritimus TaxID=29073 RepID=A0A452TA72_URSMA